MPATLDETEDELVSPNSGNLRVRPHRTDEPVSARTLRIQQQLEEATRIEDQEAKMRREKMKKRARHNPHSKPAQLKAGHARSLSTDIGAVAHPATHRRTHSDIPKLPAATVGPRGSVHVNWNNKQEKVTLKDHDENNIVGESNNSDDEDEEYAS